MPAPSDTIAAVATAPGRGGIGIVRISGPLASTILTRVCGTLPPARHAHFCSFGDPQSAGEAIDHGIALFFPGPHSFTGEDVAELQGHGGRVITDMVLRCVLRLGARLARPGEFSERAFLNGRLDLAQAEAIADLIDSGSERAARNAMRSLQGAFSARIDELLQQLVSLRAFVEASIDFPDEEIDFLSDGEVSRRLHALRAQLCTVRDTARNGVLVRDGITLVLAGRPNAGKSSLMNALAGRDIAIVTAIPGTTRDLLRQEIAIDGLPLHIIDTAGLHDSPDAVEQEGIRRARHEIEHADHLLLIIDSSTGEAPETVLNELFATGHERLPALTVIQNKCDLSQLDPGLQPGTSPPTLAVSALSGAGMAELREHLKGLAGYHDASAGEFSARRRHLDALERCCTALDDGLNALEGYAAGELLAEHLRDAQQHLGEITGQFSSDDLLGQIFGSFCIGK